MAYQITLSLAGKLISDQVESFSFADTVQVDEIKIIGGNGQDRIEHLPGREALTLLTLIRRVDAASVEFQSLFQSVKSGAVETVRGTMTLAFSDASLGPLFRYDFSRAFVSSIAPSGNRHGGTGPQEQIQIAYEDVTLVTSTAK